MRTGITFLFILLWACASHPPVQEATPAPPPPKKPPEKKVDMYRFVPPRQEMKTDADRVRSQITSNNSYFAYLHTKHSKIHPDLHGKFVLEIQISDEGLVTGCRIESSTMPHDALEKEIVEFIKNLEFGALDEGEQTVIYEFVF
jgi:TonB family protein